MIRSKPRRGRPKPSNRKDVKEKYQAIACFVMLSLTLFLVCLVMKDTICSQPEYYVRYENIRIFDPPAWIDKDFVIEALELLPKQYKRPFEQSATEQLFLPTSDDPNQSNVMVDNQRVAGIPPIGHSTIIMNSTDPKLVENLRNAFMSHDLVADVQDIMVYYPGRVDVKLTFREPIAIVDASSDSYNEFRSFLEENFTSDFNALTVYERDPSVLSVMEKQDKLNVATETGNRAPKRSRYLIDKAGKRLRSAPFDNCREAYVRLPVVVGFTASGTASAVDPAFNEAGAFLRFLNESNACQEFQIHKIGALRTTKTRHVLWFFWIGDEDSSEERVVRWGRFVPQETTNDGRRIVRDDWNSLYAFQAQKLTELRRQINEKEVEKKRLETQGEEALQTSRVEKFDLAALLASEETED